MSKRVTVTSCLNALFVFISFHVTSVVDTDTMTRLCTKTSLSRGKQNNPWVNIIGTRVPLRPLSRVRWL